MSSAVTFVCCLLPVVVSLCWGLYLVFSKGVIRRTRLYLGLALLLCALALLASAFKEIPNIPHFPFIMTSAVGALFCCPMYVFFLVRLTKLRQANWVEWMLFLPAVVYVLGVGVLHVLGVLGPDATVRAMRTLKMTFRIVLLIEMIVAVVLGELYLHEYNLLLEEYSANKDDENLQRSRLVTVFSSLTLPVVVLSLIPFENNVLTSILSLLMAFLLMLIGYYGSRIRYTAETLSARISEALPMMETQSAEVRLAVIRDNLESVAKTDLFFIDPQINVAKLALWIGTNPYYLRKTLLQYYDCSFADYINRLRIRYAMRQLQDGYLQQEGSIPSTLNQRERLQQLAMQCGFETYASFARSFPRVAHYSLSEYVASLNRSASL